MEVQLGCRKIFYLIKRQHDVRLFAVPAETNNFFLLSQNPIKFSFQDTLKIRYTENV